MCLEIWLKGRNRKPPKLFMPSKRSARQAVRRAARRAMPVKLVLGVGVSSTRHWPYFS